METDWGVILSALFGTGFVATIVGLFSIRSELKKARAEAEKAMAEADTVKITNTENATRILIQNIVEPLRNELDATRKELYRAREELKEVPPLKRQVIRLCKAMEAVKSCPYNSECPVRDELQESQGGSGDSFVRPPASRNSQADPAIPGGGQCSPRSKAKGRHGRRNPDGVPMD